MRRRFINNISEGNSMFPLYLNFDYCEDVLGGGVSCYRNPDAISIELRNYLLQKLAQYGEIEKDSFILDENALARLDIHIYIEELRVIEISCIFSAIEYEPIELVLNGWYNDFNVTYLTPDNALLLE